MKNSSEQVHESSPTDDAGGPVRAPRTDGGSLGMALDLIWRILCGRRYAVPDADIPDIAQEAALRLWKWREKYRERASELTLSEWDSFTATTTHNEIKRHFSNQTRTNDVPLDDIVFEDQSSPEGDADSEVFSLVENVWQGICRLTLYQRQALILGSPELVIYLIQFGVGEQAVVASLEISEEDWIGIFRRLPLSDREIAAIARPSKTIRDPGAAALAIGKARYDARKKLKGLRK